MTKFVTVNMFLVQNPRRDSKTTLETAPAFLAWKVGYLVRGKNGGDTWKIKEIDGDNISYSSMITLQNSDETETKQLRGSTLQSGYVFVSGTEEEEAKKTTRPMTFEIESLSRFYARKDGRPGTRLMFKDKTNYIVADDYDTLRLAIEGPGMRDVRSGTEGEQVDA